VQKVEKVLGGIRIPRVSRPILTDEQRAINEAERTQKIWASRRRNGTNHTTPECRAKISTAIKTLHAVGHYDDVDYSTSPETAEKISKGLVLAYREGRAKLTGTYKNKWHMYEGPHGSIKMRSQSETLFADHLDSLCVTWEYEPQRFDLGWATYTPDFYLPEFGLWIEVKGSWRENSRRKFDEFSLTHTASVVPASSVWQRNFQKKFAAELDSIGRLQTKTTTDQVKEI
jgi:hypothetical protein